jgi:hypothetical protein
MKQYLLLANAKCLAIIANEGKVLKRNPSADRWSRLKARVIKLNVDASFHADAVQER